MINQRGRPLGFRMSEESKRAIREAKVGQKHSNETKNKISRSLLLYFRRKYPLSQEIIDRYCRADDDVLCDWINIVGEELDSFEDVMTSKALRNTRALEISCSDLIELFSHELTPEYVLDLMESCISANVMEKEEVKLMVNSIIGN